MKCRLNRFQTAFLQTGKMTAVGFFIFPIEV